MSKTIYVVMGASGQYEDRYDFNVIAYTDEEKAIAEVARLERQNEYCMELQKIFREWERTAIKQALAMNSKNAAETINEARKATKMRIEEYIKENNIDLEGMGWTKFMFEYCYDYTDYSYHPLELEE